VIRRISRLLKVLRRISAWDEATLARVERMHDKQVLQPAEVITKPTSTPVRLCLADGATLLPEARVENLAGIPERVRVGSGTFIRGELLIFRFGGELTMGRDCYLGENSRVWAGERVSIGNDVLISHDVFITDCNAHELDPLERAAGYRKIVNEGHPLEKGNVLTAPVTLEDHVWVNPQTVILPGVTIGRGTIIGCGSVVTRSLPAGVFAAGNPARVIRELSAS
jgi:acetyltransferase-like isoleucine patch superfamily enzyme